MSYLVVIRSQLIKALLNYVVSVEILNQNDDMKTKRDDDGVDLSSTMGISLTKKKLISGKMGLVGKPNLSASGQEINHLLNSTGSMHVQRDVDKIRGNGVADEVALFVRSIFQQFLAKVVTERVGHQIGEVGKGFVEDDVSMFGGTFLQFLLQITTTVLILAQTCDFTDKVLEAGASKTVDC